MNALNVRIFSIDHLNDSPGSIPATTAAQWRASRCTYLVAHGTHIETLGPRGVVLVDSFDDLEATLKNIITGNSRVDVEAFGGLAVVAFDSFNFRQELH